MSLKKKITSPLNDEWQFIIEIPLPRFLDKDRYIFMMRPPNQDKINVSLTRYTAATSRGLYFSISNAPRAWIHVWLQISGKLIISWFIDYGEFFKLELPPGTEIYK